MTDVVHNKPYLLTPGPLTTSLSVKQAMLEDHGSWDKDFNQMTAWVCQQLLSIAHAGTDYSCVPMQGSGTFAVEAALGSLIGQQSTSLVLANGAYGQRICQILDYLKRPYLLIDTGDYLPVSAEQLSECLASNPEIEQVIVVHCETSSGILNPVPMVAALCQEFNKALIIDSMSGFGALDCNSQKLKYRALIASANKCLHGVPGFGFVIVQNTWLAKCAGNSHSLSLDLHAQWQYMEKTGQWRFTPPTHVLAACSQALREYQTLGGQAARLEWYQQNQRLLVNGLEDLGLQTLLPRHWQSPMITTFFAPQHPNWDFTTFYQLIKAQGYIIYPGKLTQVASFRVGSMGELTQQAMLGAVRAIKQALSQMEINPATCPQMAREPLWNQYAV